MLKENKIIYKTATKEQSEIIHKTLSEVYENLENKNTFVCDTLTEVKDCIEKNGFGIIAYNKKKKIIGIFLVRYPGISESNLGKDIGLSKEELLKVVHMESAVVIPEYRGNGLQQKMLQYAETIIDKNKYKYFMATVSPDNPASFKSLEKNGYVHITTKKKYNNISRRIYLKEIQ